MVKSSSSLVKFACIPAVCITFTAFFIVFVNILISLICIIVFCDFCDLSFKRDEIYLSVCFTFRFCFAICVIV